MPARVAAAASSAIPVAVTPANRPSAETPIHTAPGKSTRNGTAARAAVFVAEQPDRHRDGDRDERTDEHADERRPAAAAEADPVEADEDEQRAGRVPGDVGGPRVGLEVEDPGGESAQHGGHVGDPGHLVRGIRGCVVSRPAKPRCQPSTSARATVQATAAT